MYKDWDPSLSPLPAKATKKTPFKILRIRRSVSMEEFTHPGFVAAASSAIWVLDSSRTAVGDEVPPSPAARCAAGWMRRVGAGKFSLATKNTEFVTSGWRCRSQVWHRPGFAVKNLTAGPRKRGIPVPPCSLTPPPRSLWLWWNPPLCTDSQLWEVCWNRSLSKAWGQTLLGHRRQPPLTA